MSPADPPTAQAAVDAHPFWYHTLEIAPGVTTQGWFDLRPILGRLPIPDVRGKRCLEVGPFDGFFSFELERRGAAEVVAVDIADRSGWDWRYSDRRQGPHALAEIMDGGEIGAGLALAKKLIGSDVERVNLSVYDLTPERLGAFDVVVCGSLMLHLRDPVRALEAIRSVTNGHFFSSETVSLDLSVRAPRRPAAELRGGHKCQWWVPNVIGHRELVESAGFAIEKTTRPYAIPFGVAHGFVKRRAALTREVLLARMLAGGPGVPHAALVARPID